MKKEMEMSITTERLSLVPLRSPLFYGFWLIMKKTDGAAIGEICFMDFPNKRGEIEVGYELNEKDRNQGYMTEAVGAICDWVLKLPNVKSIIAETERNNAPSEQVLKKCGFREEGFEGNIRWRISYSL